VAALVPQNARSVLDVGCAAGEMGRLLKETGFQRVVGIERDAESAAHAREVLDEVVEGDVERIELPFEQGCFDCIVFADVLEHLIEPQEVLRRFRDYLTPDGVVIASIPNVRFAGVISNLVEGYWRYTDQGILDRSHLRFFTFNEIQRMFDAAGYEIVGRAANVSRKLQNLELGPGGTFTFGRLTIRGLSEEEFHDLLTYQHIVTARRRIDDPIAFARTKIDDGQFSEALEIVNAADPSATDRTELLVARGECLAKLERLTEAETAYRAAVEEDPAGDRALTGLGAVLILQGKHEEALSRFEQAAELNPRSDKALCGIGLALRAAGEPERALAAFVKSLDENRENVPALMNLVHVAYELDNMEPAAQYLKKYLEYYPANFDIQFILAGVLYRKRDFDEARAAIDTVLAFNPGQKDALDLLAKIDAADQRD
jgi:Tfp pilus assembly protein PilF/SAM-dependent methyltransferase